MTSPLEQPRQPDKKQEALDLIGIISAIDQVRAQAVAALETHCAAKLGEENLALLRANQPGGFDKVKQNLLEQEA